MTTVRRGFTLDDEQDAAILSRLDAESNRSAVVRRALREHYGQAVSLADIYAAVQSLSACVAAGVLPVALAIPEEPDIAAALDNLGL